MEIEIIFFIILGIIAGTFSGMFGIGGGVFVVPFLSIIFNYMGFEKTLIIKYSIATSLSIMVLTSISSFYFHYKNKNVIFEILKKIIFFMIFGTIIGTIFAHFLKSEVLTILFAVFLLLISIKMFIGFNIKKRKKVIYPSLKILSFFGSIIGLKSGLLGIGGGSLSVPMLSYFGYPMRKAAGTSSSFTLIISIVGTVSYIILGSQMQSQKDFLGYIYIPAFLITSIFSYVFANVGARLANIISNKLLRIMFAVFLLLLSLKMFFFDLIFS
ncbi:MAG: hypothetical protein K1060chlam5_00681 [Candidatus Anoxychlamydiales bacterium]|nr:hypothetical protein [Candidatus Anoxychlamydiales bacterium]